MLVRIERCQFTLMFLTDPDSILESYAPERVEDWQHKGETIGETRQSQIVSAIRARLEAVSIPT